MMGSMFVALQNSDVDFVRKLPADAAGIASEA